MPWHASSRQGPASWHAFLACWQRCVRSRCRIVAALAPWGGRLAVGGLTAGRTAWAGCKLSMLASDVARHPPLHAGNVLPLCCPPPKQCQFSVGPRRHIHPPPPPPPPPPAEAQPSHRGAAQCARHGHRPPAGHELPRRGAGYAPGAPHTEVSSSRRAATKHVAARQAGRLDSSGWFTACWGALPCLPVCAAATRASSCRRACACSGHV